MLANVNVLIMHRLRNSFFSLRIVYMQYHVPMCHKYSWMSFNLLDKLSSIAVDILDGMASPV